MRRDSGSFDFDEDYSSADDDDADFELEVNRTRASYMAYSHVLSEQYVLLKGVEDDDDDDDDVRGEMVRAMIERKATVCRDAVALALKMQRRRQWIRDQMQLSRENFSVEAEHVSQGAAEYQERQNSKRMRSIMLKGGLLGFTPNIIESSHLPEEVAAFQRRQNEKKRRGVLLKGGLLGTPQLHSELLSRQRTQ